MAQPCVDAIRIFAGAGGVHGGDIERAAIVAAAGSRLPRRRLRPMHPGPPVRSTSQLTRRSLLRLGAAATAGTLVGIRPWAAASVAAAGGPAVHLLRSSYKGLAGQGFTLASGQLRLLAVSNVAGAAVEKGLAGSEDAFVLAFSRPRDAVLEAGTHTLSHAQLGAFELFVSPVGRPRRDRRYEAVVDRSVAARKPPRRRRLRPAGDTSRRSAAG
jgi:hypothetical protein